MYQAIYKCRLCGEKYEGCVTKSETLAMTFIYGIRNKEYFQPIASEIGIHKTECHNCQNGSFGLADFQGFNKVED